MLRFTAKWSGPYSMARACPRSKKMVGMNWQNLMFRHLNMNLKTEGWPARALAIRIFRKPERRVKISARPGHNFSGSDFLHLGTSLNRPRELGQILHSSKTFWKQCRIGE